MRNPSPRCPFILILTVALCAIQVCGKIRSVSRTLSEVEQSSIFNLGVHSSNVLLKLILAPSDFVSSTYAVEIYQQDFTNQVFEQTATGINQIIFRTTVAGVVYLKVIPLGNNFRFTLDYYADQVKKSSFVDVARTSAMLVLYSSQNQMMSVEVNGADAFITVNGPFSSISLNGGNQVAQSNIGDQLDPNFNHITTVKFQGQLSSYYIATIVFTDQREGPLSYTMSYLTNSFPCPFSSTFTDVNKVFDGCNHPSSKGNLPCINFDTSVQRCRACLDPFILNVTEGSCQLNQDCPEGQYSKYGQCLQKLKNCDDFDSIGGLCKKCDLEYDLVNEAEGQRCKRVSCKEEDSYLKNEQCKKKVENCAQFYTVNETCQYCQQGFFIQNNQCYPIPVIQEINCRVGTINIEGSCEVFDKHCIFYRIDNICFLCAKGYNYDQSTNRCQEIICKERQYSSPGFCVDVSVLCTAYDKIHGNCQDCIPGYYLQFDGRCLQAAPDGAGGLAALQCPKDHYAKGNTCVQANPLCFTFSQQDGKCTSCSNQYFLKDGDCIQIKGYCKYREFFLKGNCFNVSPLCDQFKYIGGQCIKCYDNLLMENGNCLYDEICKDRQYKKPDGSCEKVHDDCVTYDKANGHCLTCQDDYETNSGVCCYQQNYMLATTNCIQFFSLNCVKQHPKFQYCQQCSEGYFLKFGPFGRCHPV